MKTLVALTLTLAALPATASAQTPPPAPRGTLAPLRYPGSPGTLASATKLVSLMKLEGVLDRMFEQLTPLLVSNVMASVEREPAVPAGLKLRLADTATRSKAQAIISEEVMRSYRKRYPDVFADAAKAYAATFSEADLQAAIVFYSSPTGQRFVDAQPWLQQTLGEAGQKMGMAAGMEAVPAAFTRILALPAPGTK